MNKPMPDIRQPDDDPRPLDENGQQIWSDETDAAMTCLHVDPAFWAKIEEGLADIAAGQMYTHEEVFQRLAERKRLWRAERGL